MANNVHLNSSDHKSLRVHNRYSAELGDNVMYSPTFAREFKTIQSHYPIVFQQQAGDNDFIAVALFGLQSNENLFLTDSGWDAPYIPIMMQRLPFSIALYHHTSTTYINRIFNIHQVHPILHNHITVDRLFSSDGFYDAIL